MRRALARILFAAAAAHAAACQTPSRDIAKVGPSSAAHADPTPPTGTVEPGPAAPMPPGDKVSATPSTAAGGRGAGEVRSADGYATLTTRRENDTALAIDGNDGDKKAAIGGDTFRNYGVNPWFETAKDKLSTFAIDVDTASYTLARRMLNAGTLPPAAAIRVEELVNYFTYRYPAPDRGRPFSVTTDLATSPFRRGRHIIRVGVASKPKSIAERKPANLVFLVDVSGSMGTPDRLPLAKSALRILVENLGEKDTVSLVTYAGSTRVALPPTGLDGRNRILAAIDELDAGGSTAMASGIELAYQQAAKGLRPDAISRVIILSDGDANVGSTSHEQILASIAGKVKEGVTLSTIGFGMGNYRDDMMEQLANKGNGNNFYIDGIAQARRVFQQQLSSTLEVVAKDVKIQVELDPAVVQRYRLIGYENRDVADVDFRNDQVDAGEIGAGHQVTALYEVELVEGATAQLGRIGGLLQLGTVRVRHKEPRGEKAMESAYPVAGAFGGPFDSAAADFRFAFATAAFAEVLRGSEDASQWSLAEIRRIAVGATGDDTDRKELVALIDRAVQLKPGPKTAIAR